MLWIVRCSGHPVHASWSNHQTHCPLTHPTLQVTLVVAGARNGIVVPTNCTLVSTTWVKAADKIGTLIYTCTAYNNLTSSFPFVVMGGEIWPGQRDASGNWAPLLVCL